MVVFTGSDSFPEETYEFSNNSDYDHWWDYCSFVTARLQNVLLTSYVIDKYDEKIEKINFYTGQDN